MTTTDTTFQIEEIIPVTFPAWRALRLRALAGHPEAFLQTPEEYGAIPPDEACDQFFSRLGPRSRVWGAFAEDGSLMGMTGLYCDDGVKMAHRAHIWGVYVAPEARGHGVGEALMRHAIAFAQGLDGVLQADLKVASGNERAKRLYQRLGFLRYGIEPRVLIVEGVVHDEDLMVLPFDDYPILATRFPRASQ
ncbi:MAG: GNAT family N-acetyltransferase [Thermomicrobiales bacterium]